jgi:hypothetical protein
MQQMMTSAFNGWVNGPLEFLVALKGRSADFDKSSSGGYPGLLDVSLLDSQRYFRKKSQIMLLFYLVWNEVALHLTLGKM